MLLPAGVSEAHRRSCLKQIAGATQTSSKIRRAARLSPANGGSETDKSRKNFQSLLKSLCNACDGGISKCGDAAAMRAVLYQSAICFSRDPKSIPLSGFGGSALRSAAAFAERPSQSHANLPC